MYHFLMSCCWSLERGSQHLLLADPLEEGVGCDGAVTLSLLCPSLSKLSDLNHLRPFTILVILLWTLSNILMPLLHQGALNCSQYLRWGCTGQCRVRPSPFADPLLHLVLCSVCTEVGRVWWNFSGQVLPCLMDCFSINVK